MAMATLMNKHFMTILLVGSCLLFSSISASGLCDGEGCVTLQTCSASDCPIGIKITNKAGETNTLEIQISSKRGEGSYMAIGFSKDLTMGDDLAVACLQNGQLKELSTPSHAQPTEKNFTEGSPKNFKSANVNGIFTCTFSQPVKVKGKSPSGADLSFDLSDNSVTILAATGQIDGNGNIKQHDWRSSSAGKLNVPKNNKNNQDQGNKSENEGKDKDDKKSKPTAANDEKNQGLSLNSNKMNGLISISFLLAVFYGIQKY